MKRLEKLKDSIRDKEIKQFFIMQRSLLSYIQRLKEQDENITVKNVKEKIYSEIYDVHMIVDQHKGKKVLSSGKSDLFFLYTIQYILKNPSVISKVYYMVVEKDRDVFLEKFNGKEYGEDITRNIIFIMHDFLRAQEKRYKKTIKNLSQEDLELLTEQICTFSKDMIEKEKFEERIKCSYAKRLSRMISLLDEFGELEIYNNLNNERLERMDLLDELGFKYKEEKNDYKITAIMDLKDEKSLNKLSLEELTVLICFYLNRIVKIAENIEKVLFTLQKRGLFGRFYRGEDISQRLTDEDVRLSLAQYKFLTEYGEILLKRYQDDKMDENEGYMFYSINDVLQYMEEQEARDYKAFVKQNNKKLQARLSKDIEEIQGLISSKHNLYFYKDRFMEIMMYHLLTSSKDINWGYVEERERLNNGYNSIQNYSRNVLIKADIKGFNNPITLHYNLQRLKNFMKNFNGTQIIPVYEGEEDFVVEGRGGSKVYMTNFVLMPLQNSKRKKLLKKVKTAREDSIYYKYMKHLAWISSPKSVPQHLLKDGRLIKKMIDLKTGEIEEVETLPEIR